MLSKSKGHAELPPAGQAKAQGMKQIIFQDLGSIRYQKAWDYQEQLFKELVNRKVSNRELPPGQQEPLKHYLLFCEHPHVYTLGKSGSMNHVLISAEERERAQIDFHKINRGGDITYHGPGQVVGYPILDLDDFFTDIHKYLRNLEDVIIRTLAEYGIKAGRFEGATGVWLDEDNPRYARKICAMGVRCSRWVTMHGWAFNVNTDLKYFNHIIPCGITDKSVTSLQKELGYEPDMAEVKQKLKKNFEHIFKTELV